MTAAKPDHEFVRPTSGRDECDFMWATGGMCGLPRSAHVTPPRSELADQLEALAKAATPGPWRREFDEHYRHFTVEALPTFVPTVDANFAASEIVAKVADIDNAALIVALVNALPEILTALRRTR